MNKKSQMWKHLAQLVEKLKAYAKQNASHQNQTADKW
jgi:uncharacterized coiled-coil protein SlyX